MYLEKFRLDGRLAVITGGGGAIGLETARAFAEAGAKVIVSDGEEDAVAAAVAGLKETGHAAEGIAFDVASPEAVEAAAAKVEKDNGRPADILVCSAGIARSETPRRRLPTSIGGMFWMSILTACFGAAAPLAKECWRRAAGRL